MKTPKIFIVLLACVGLSGIANATILPPGGSGAPDVFAPLPGATLQASIGGPFTTSGSVSGSYTAAVYSDPSNVFGSGRLDFVIQLSNSAMSLDAIVRATTQSFTGFLTDVGYTATGSAIPGGLFVNGTTVPISVDRSLSGDTVGFQMGAAPNGIPPGQTSVALIIETNAQFFSNGNLNVIDGGTTTLRVFAPILPDGGSAVTLLGVALAGIEFLRRRFKS